MLAFDAFGKTENPCVVLLHGWPLDRTIWAEVGLAVAGQGYRVLAPDLPSFGDSSPVPAGRETVEEAADQVAEFLKGSGPRSAAVAGHSFGGYVALALAERHADLVAGLGLVASRTSADSEVARKGRLETIEKVRASGAQALLPDLPKRLLAPNAPAGLVEKAHALVERARPEGIVLGLAAMAARPDRSHILRDFPGPVLVVHGDADQLIPVEQASPVPRPDADVREILPGVGHLPPWEAPEATARAVAAWASRATAR